MTKTDKKGVLLHLAGPCVASAFSTLTALRFSSSSDTSLQLRRDVIFCQAATGAFCTLAEQLLAALRLRFNNAGEYQEDGVETSRKWLEQISVIGVLMHFQSTLSPHMVRFTMTRGVKKTRQVFDFSPVLMEVHVLECVPQSLTVCKILLLLWLQKEERTMLEDTKAALSDLDKVTVFFRQLEDECLVASKRRGQNQTLPLVQVALQLASCML